MASFPTTDESRDSTYTEPSTSSHLPPSLMENGISLLKNHLSRDAVVQQIYDTAKKRQHVILGSAAATGKTSLLQLLEKRLCEDVDIDNNINVIRISMKRPFTVESFMNRLAVKRIEPDNLQSINNETWLLLDDAQNCYHEEFVPIWQFLMKEIAAAGVDDNLFVVIATTYDYLSASGSIVDFYSHEHVHPNITKAEARELFAMHANVWGVAHWESFCTNLLQISKYSTPMVPQQQPNQYSFYHIGVLMAGIDMLNAIRKQPNQRAFDERSCIDALRTKHFVQFLHRCFHLPDDISQNYKHRLLDVLSAENNNKIVAVNDPMLAPLFRAGLLTKDGHFSCTAAHWYYNHQCFPERAL